VGDTEQRRTHVDQMDLLEALNSIGEQFKIGSGAAAHLDPYAIRGDGQQTVKIFAAVQQKFSRRIVLVCLVRVEGLHALLVGFAPNWRKGEPIKHPETVSD